MSKSRTGRKGRVRLAVAAALGDLDSAVGGASIVDADGRLGDGSGHRSEDAAKSNAAILDLVQTQLAKPGTANALFQQGEVRGPLTNDIDTRNGATGVFSNVETGDLDAGGDGSAAYASDVKGEVDAAALAPLSNSADGTFAHYVLPDATEVDGLAGQTALIQAAGGALVNTGARTAQIVSKEAFGICYHQGGPGSDFVPVQHLGGAAGSTFGASAISLEPTMDTIYGAVTAAQVNSGPTKVQVKVLGHKIANAACTGGSADAEGTAGAKADEIVIYPTNNGAASTAFRYKRDSVGAAADGAHMPTGAEIVIRGNDGVLMSIITAITGGVDGVTLAADGTADITGAGIGTGGNTNGKNFYHDTTSGTNKVYIISPKSDAPNGATAYTAGTPAVDISKTMIAAINSLADQEKLGITANIDGATDVKVTMDRLRGADGNNTVDSPGENLTITAYSSNGQIVVPAGGNGHNFFGDVADGDNAAAHVEFSGGTDSTTGVTLYGGTVTRLAATDTQVSVDIDPQDFPVRIAYIANAQVKRDVASGATHGIGSAQIDCGMLLAADKRVTLRFTVPVGRGGEGVTDIVVDEADTTGATGDGANAIGMGSQGLAGGGGPAASAAILVNAINGKAVATSTPASGGNGTLEDATGGLNFGIKGVVAEDAGGGIVNVFLGPAAEGFADDGSPDCLVARQSGDENTSLGVVRHSFQPAGQPIDKNGGFAFIWGPAA